MGLFKSIGKFFKGAGKKIGGVAKSIGGKVGGIVDAGGNIAEAAIDLAEASGDIAKATVKIANEIPALIETGIVAVDELVEIAPGVIKSVGELIGTTTKALPQLFKDITYMIHQLAEVSVELVDLLVMSVEVLGDIVKFIYEAPILFFAALLALLVLIVIAIKHI